MGITVSGTSLPLVSVIIPVFNRAGIIERSLRSVLAQTVDDLEVIVVDDGSRDVDALEDVIASIHDLRIILVKLDRNRGLSAARNAGINAARGRYLAFQDSDDYWMPEKLARQLEVFERTGDRKVGLVYCRYYGETDEGESEVTGPMLRGHITDEILDGQFRFIGTQMYLVRRDVFAKDVKFDESMRHTEDRDYLIRCSLEVEIDGVDMPLVKIDRKSGLPRLTDNLKARARAHEYLTSKYRHLLEERAGLLPRYYGKVAEDYYRCRESSGIRRACLNACLTGWTDPRNWVRLMGAAAGWQGYRIARRFVDAPLRVQ